MIKRWHRHMSVRAPNPSGADMEKFTGDYATLYRREEPTTPGRPGPTHITPFKVNYNIPSEAEV